MTVYLDGIPGFREDIQTIPASDVAGIEIYKTEYDLPLLFSNALFSGASIACCGAIAVWTRDWRSDLTEDW